MTDCDIAYVVIVGAGTMGRQIAAALALGGADDIVLIDEDPAALRAAAQWLDGFLEDERVRGAIRVAPALTDEHADAQLIIEAVVEDEEVKRHLLSRLVAFAPHATVASNSSTLPVARFTGDVADPARLVNLHFYVRPWERRVVELMTSGRTDPRRLEALGLFMRRRDFRVFTLAGPSFGLLYNRIWAAVKRESLAIVDEGIATPQEVDEIYRALEPHPARGPFERMDAVGLDTALLIERSYAAERGTVVSAALRGLVDSGSLGVKSGAGFYEYSHTSSERTSS